MQIATATDTARATKSEAVANKQLAATKPQRIEPLANVQRNAQQTGNVITLKALLTEYKLPSDGKLARRFLRKASFGQQANDVRGVLAKLVAKADKK